jgi:hypothetical protein
LSTAFSEVRDNLELEDECRVLQEQGKGAGRERKESQIDGSKAAD